MAPFKLKFRMGNSRSASQEHDADPQVNEALLNHHGTTTGESTSTIDSTDCNSLGSGSVVNNERKSLLPSKKHNLHMGYVNQRLEHSISENTATVAVPVPTTPPPSYEHVLEENNRMSSQFERKHHRQPSGDSNRSQYSCRSSNSLNNLNLNAALEQLNLNSGNITNCTDPECEQNQQYGIENNAESNISDNDKNNDSSNSDHCQDNDNGNENEHNICTDSVNCAYKDNDIGEQREDCKDYDDKESKIDINEFLKETNMSSPSSRENLLENCTDEHCSQYGAHGGIAISERADVVGVVSGGARRKRPSDRHGFYDPLMNHHEYYNEVAHYNERQQQYQHRQKASSEYMLHNADVLCGIDSWDLQPLPSRHQRQHASVSAVQKKQLQLQQQQRQQQQQQQLQFQQGCTDEITAELMSNKTSKEIYKDLAKQWGITCKMSESCRCMDCQSHYFDCGYEDNEQQKSDGGLGAGTPMFISEVMHGSACNIL